MTYFSGTVWAASPTEAHRFARRMEARKPRHESPGKAKSATIDLVRHQRRIRAVLTEQAKQLAKDLTVIYQRVGMQQKGSHNRFRVSRDEIERAYMRLKTSLPCFRLSLDQKRISSMIIRTSCFLVRRIVIDYPDFRVDPANARCNSCRRASFRPFL